MSSNKLTPILFLSAKQGLTQFNLNKLMGINNNTLKAWVNNPCLISIGNLIKLAGLCNVTTIELLYLLMINKPQITKDIKNTLQSHLNEIQQKYDL